MTTLSLPSNDYFICYDHRNGFIIVQKYFKFLCMKALLRWNEIGRVGPNQKYNALEVFGVTIRGRTLEKLSTDLRTSSYSVNRQGHSYLRESYHTSGIWKLFKSERYVRLNKPFSWSQYGVTVPTITTFWNRIYQKIGKWLFNYKGSSEFLDKLHQIEKELTDCKSKVTSLEAEKMELRNCISKVTSLEAEVGKYKKELSDCISKVTKLEAEVCKYKKELSDGQSKVSSLETQVGKYTKELEEQNNIIVYIKDKQAELESKQEELSICKKDSEEKSKLLEARNKEVQDLKAELSDIKEKSEKNKKEKDEELAKWIRDLKVAINYLGISYEAFNDLASAA